MPAGAEEKSTQDPSSPRDARAGAVLLLWLWLLHSVDGLPLPTAVLRPLNSSALPGAPESWISSAPVLLLSVLALPLRMLVFLFVCVCACVRACVCVCVFERERWRCRAFLATNWAPCLRLRVWDSHFFSFLFFFFVFLGPQHMEVPRLEVKSELQLPACATATATPGPSPTERGQGWNPHPHGSSSRSFPLRQDGLPGAHVSDSPSSSGSRLRVWLSSLRSFLWGWLRDVSSSCADCSLTPRSPGCPTRAACSSGAGRGGWEPGPWCRAGLRSPSVPASVTR